MSRRPSVIGEALKAPEPEPAPVTPAKTKGGIVHTSVYIPEPAYEVLRGIVFSRGRRAKIHDLLIEGIDAVLQRHGKPTVKELSGK